MNQNLVIFVATITVLLFVALYGSLSFTVWNLKKDHNNFQKEFQEFRKIANSFESDPAILNSLKRISQQASTPQSVTKILADTLTELIEKKLYTIMECSR